MQPTRRVLILSIAASAALAACGGGSSADAGSLGTGGLGSDDLLSITTFSPSSAPATSALPITFTVSFSVDLESTSAGVVTAGYQLARGSIVNTTSALNVGKGPGTGQLNFSLPASALSSSDLGVVVTLTDASSGAVLAQDIAIVPRS